MQKVYLLLRSNRQIGPHTAEELATMNLQPTDLIWIEGQSTGWLNPHEIAALQPYINGATTSPTASVQLKNNAPVTSQKPAAGKAKESHIYVSMPQKTGSAPAHPQHVPEQRVQSLEGKAEALRQRAQAYMDAHPAAANPEEERPRYNNSLQELEEKYKNWTLEQTANKKRKVLLQQMLAAVVVTAALAGGFFIAKDAFSSRYKNDGIGNSSTAQPVPSANEAILALHTESTEAEPTYEAAGPEADGTQEAPVKVLPAKTNAALLLVKTNGEEKASPVYTTVKQVEAVQREGQKEETTAVPQQAVAENTVAVTPEKKTLSQKLNRFFDKFKKKKEEEAATEETGASVPQSSGGERTASRRSDEGRSGPESAGLAQLIDISSNAATADNFMAGVHGLQLTVRNRSNETVKNGAVEVRYYNDNKELIDKRTVSFTNIPPNKKITVKAPDHRLADHTDYRLVSVN